MIKLYVFYNQKGMKLIRQVADEVITFKDKKLARLFSNGALIRPFEIMSKEEFFVDPLSRDIIIGRFPSGSKFKISRTDFKKNQGNKIVDYISNLCKMDSIFTTDQRLEIDPDTTVFLFQRIQKTAAK